jgi:hypothetical protein
VVRQPAAVDVSVELVAPLPDELAAALDAGAEVRLAYPLKVKARRKGWFDRRVWSGRLVTIVSFDAVTGRYRCEVVLDGIITKSGELSGVAAARQWLTAPPAVRVELAEERRDDELKIRARAVFSTGTTWLIFPTQDATPWTEIRLPLEPDPAAAGEAP